MARIAISYRREDTGWITGRIFDRLKEHYEGDESPARRDGNAVFMDYDSIPIGVDFRRHLQNTLETCDALLVIIGPRWAGDNRAGGKRITEPNDWVRVEVATALNKDIPVIPVLVDRTPMPAADTLPEDVRGLTYRQAVVLDSQIDFNTHIDRLTRQLDRMLKLDVPQASATKRRPAAAVVSEAIDEVVPRRHKRLAAYAAAAAVLLCAVAAWSWHYYANRGVGPVQRYESPQLGVSFDYPTELLPLDRTEENKRKLTLKSADGNCVVTITRELRPEGKDIVAERDREMKNYIATGYTVEGKTFNQPDGWYMLSGRKLGEIYYVRRWYTTDSVVRADFRYPEALKDRFAPTTGIIGNRLIPIDPAPKI